VDGEDIRLSGLVSGRLMMDYTLWCASGPIARRVFGDFLTTRMGVSVGRLPQEVLLEEFYRSECFETVQYYLALY
jgi:hypothetical protein